MTMSCFLINSNRAPKEFLIIKLTFHLNFHLCTFKMLQAHFTSYRWDSKEGGVPSSINWVNANMVYTILRKIETTYNIM